MSVGLNKDTTENPRLEKKSAVPGVHAILNPSSISWNREGWNSARTLQNDSHYEASIKIETHLSSDMETRMWKSLDGNLKEVDNNACPN